jgi:hypothetical protein
MGASCGSHVVIVTVISRVQAPTAVSREGIEPSTRGLKVPCSATELPAQPELSLPNLVGKTHRRVYKRGDGRIVDEYQDEYGKRRCVSGKSESETRQKHRKLLEDQDAGIGHDSERLAVERYMDCWLDSIRGLQDRGTCC